MGGLIWSPYGAFGAGGPCVWPRLMPGQLYGASTEPTMRRYELDRWPLWMAVPETSDGEGYHRGLDHHSPALEPPRAASHTYKLCTGVRQRLAVLGYRRC